MTKLSVLLGFAAIAAASPVALPQEIDIEGILAAGPPPTATIATVPTIITYNPSVLASQAAAAITSAPLVADASDATSVLPDSFTALDKRQIATIDYLTALNKRQVASTACSTRPVQPTGAGPVPSPDTASAFLSYEYFSSVASNAPTPTGYASVFTNLHAENSAYGYMGYTVLNSYDTQSCANQCNQIYGCQSINILFERDPTVDPGTGCDDPPSTTVIKCVFWGSPVTPQNAVNSGQWRDQFQVVVSGSNGYVSQNYPKVANYTGPVVLGNASINAPLDCNNANTYMGYVSWNDGAPFDPSRCAAACTAQSNYNLAHPPSDGSAPMLCTFYNTYLLIKNGFTQAQVCAMYNETWNATYAVNTGYTSGSDVYTIASSVTYSNTTNPGVCVPSYDLGAVKPGEEFTLLLHGITYKNQYPTGRSIGLYNNGLSNDFNYDGEPADVAVVNSATNATFWLDVDGHLCSSSGSVAHGGTEEAEQEPYNAEYDYKVLFQAESTIVANDLYQPVCRVATDGTMAFTCVGITGKSVFYDGGVYWRIGSSVPSGGYEGFTLTAVLI